jgi:hypothetical protein
VSDPLRSDSINSPEQHAETERDAKVERLLLTGLDHYFSSDYAQAIDVWTRALFIDRGHARARAYIDRARSALAEQQRESEELLHNGIAAFERGEIGGARQLLNAAVQRGGAHEVALAFLTRIERINAATPGLPLMEVAPVLIPTLPFSAPAARRFGGVLSALFALSVAAVGVYALTPWGQVRALIPSFGAASEAGLAPVIPAREPLIVPRESEAAMERARALFASGHPHDALRALELVRPADALRGEADTLKETIQRELIVHHTAPAAPVNP